MQINFGISQLSLDNVFSTPEEAIRFAGKLLLNKEACKPEYIDAMVAVYHEFGPVIVLDSGIAMPHARPEKGALKTAFSVVTLKNDLIFHHDEFDPVSVVIAITATDSDSHIKLIQCIATLIEDNIVEFVKQNNDHKKIMEFIQQIIERTSSC